MPQPVMGYNSFLLMEGMYELLEDINPTQLQAILILSFVL